MLLVSGINFNSKVNQKSTANNQQRPSFKMHSQPMQDKIQFGSAVSTVEAIIKPAAEDIYTFFGKPFIQNAKFHRDFVATELYKPSEAKKIVTQINKEVKSFYEFLRTFKPEELDKWVGQILKNRDKLVTVEPSAYGHYDQYGQFEKFLLDLKAGISEDEPKLFLELKKQPLEFSPGESSENRMGDEMKKSLKNYAEQRKYTNYVDKETGNLYTLERGSGDFSEREKIYLTYEGNTKDFRYV